MRETLKTILNKEIEILPELLKKMDPEKRAEILTRLLPFIMPKNYNIEERGEIIIDFTTDDS